MDRKKLDQIWHDLEMARRSPQTADDLADLAQRCGRTVKAGGNHPMWRSCFPAHRAFPIARHGGNQPVAKHVRKIVLEHLEADAAAWEEIIMAKEWKPSGNGEG